MVHNLAFHIITSQPSIKRISSIHHLGMHWVRSREPLPIPKSKYWINSRRYNAKKNYIKRFAHPNIKKIHQHIKKNYKINKEKFAKTTQFTEKSDKLVRKLQI
jgi:hypothetical protein